MGSQRYSVELLPKAEKDLDDLRQFRDQAVREILKLEHDPHLGHALKGSLRGARALEFNLKGGGAYRAVYSILADDRICLIFLVGPHEGIYKKAERRFAALHKTR